MAEDYTYFTSMLEQCPKCGGETHFYCKSLVIWMMLEVLRTKQPQKEKLRCGKTIELKIY